MASKKQYSSPTYSSNQKSFPPVNMRERIVRLTESVNELKSNVETEAQNQDTLEKSNTKNYAVLNTQIKALRKAFNTLADVIMEELDSIKTEVFRDFQDSNASVYRKIDEISSHVLGIQNEKQENQAQVVALEQDLRERMRILEKREDENRQYIQSIAESTKEDQRALYEKFSGLIKNHTAKIDNLTQENEILQSALSELQRKTNDDTHNINEIYNKIAFVDRVLKEQGEDLVQKFNEARTQTSNLRENLKAELQNVVKGQTDSTRRFEEITLKISERVEANELGADKRYAELEDFVNQVQQEFQENVQELAKIHKDSSTQIIVDFEKAVTSVNNENKVLLKRCTVLESSVSKVREDLGDAITNNERNAGRKNEQLNRAMFDICRQLNITNPLLSY